MPTRRSPVRRARAISEKVRSARPARHSSRKSSTSTPTSSSALPRMRNTNREKKFASALTSPSMRSINSPGVCEV